MASYLDSGALVTAGIAIGGSYAGALGLDTDGHRMSPALVEDISNLDVYGRSSPYTGPVRIIHGDGDDIAPLEYARRYLDRYSGNAELEVVEGADHAWSTVPHRAHSTSPRCSSSTARTSRTARRGELSASAGDSRFHLPYRRLDL